VLKTTCIMRRNFTKGLGLAALALAGLAGTGQVAQSKALAPASVNTVEYNATKEAKRTKGAINVNQLGGLDMTPPIPRDFGLTPKEYGMRYGNGGSKHSNRLRYTHNAKLKRRMAA
jgi:hypothetical protein